MAINARISQAVRETLIQTTGEARVVQAVRETLIPVLSAVTLLPVYDSDTFNQFQQPRFYGTAIGLDINDGSVPQSKKKFFPVVFVVT